MSTIWSFAKGKYQSLVMRQIDAGKVGELVPNHVWQPLVCGADEKWPDGLLALLHDLGPRRVHERGRDRGLPEQTPDLKGAQQDNTLSNHGLQTPTKHVVAGATATVMIMAIATTGTTSVTAAGDTITRAVDR